MYFCRAISQTIGCEEGEGEEEEDSA